MASINNASSASNAAITASGSQISKQNETLYHESNLIGTWKGTWSNSKQPITFKVLKITGDTAEIEYDHNGKVEKGQASVSKNIITYGDISIGTKNGTKGAIEFAVGTIKQTGTLTKAAGDTKTPADPSKLVGSWSGLTPSGNAASFTVKSVTGDTALVTYSVNGITRSGPAYYDAANHVISYKGAQIRSTDGSGGDVTFTSIGNTYSVPVKKASATSGTTSKFA